MGGDTLKTSSFVPRFMPTEHPASETCIIDSNMTFIPILFCISEMNTAISREMPFIAELSAPYRIYVAVKFPMLPWATLCHLFLCGLNDS